MSDQKSAISISKLEKTFRIGLRRKRSVAVRGLDLEVAQGEIFGFLGPNGAGKTTTIKILMGLIRADKGQASLFGQAPGDAQVRQRVAYLPELPDFYDYLKPAEFLFHCGRLSGLEPALIRKKVPIVLEQVGLEPSEKRQLRKFSKGMLQRVGIAQTMLADPDLYVLDEPMGGLDPIGRRWVKDLIHQLGQQGKTVFFSSHVLAEAEAVCSRVAFLNKGRLVNQGSLGEVLARHSGAWEILVAGAQAARDQSLAELFSESRPAGPDSLLVLDGARKPESVLPSLAEKGYELRSVNRVQATLEDAFIRMVDQDGEA